MGWKDDRDKTIEDKLNQKLERIKNDLDNGHYFACVRIPNGIELMGKTKAQKTANTLRERCSKKGIDGWLMSRIYIVIFVTIILAGAISIGVFISTSSADSNQNPAASTPESHQQGN